MIPSDPWRSLFVLEEEIDLCVCVVGPGSRSKAVVQSCVRVQHCLVVGVVLMKEGEVYGCIVVY